MKIPFFSTLFIVGAFITTGFSQISVTASPHDQVFPDIATTWDEGAPLGNAIVGTIIWQKGNNLRFALDRIDLWDLRPMDFIDSPEFSFKWIYDQVKKNDYAPVQRILDAPYNIQPGPSKIPGAAIEFDTRSLGKVTSNHLYLRNAVCEITWDKGTKLQTYVHATEPIGVFLFTGVDENFTPSLIPPVYASENDSANDNSHAGSDLNKLGYPQGEIKQTGQTITYTQPGWGDFSYQVTVTWKRDKGNLYGVWSITSSLVKERAEQLAKNSITKDNKDLYASHQNWWASFWNKSSIALPDPVLEKQYYNEIYKFGSIARENSYPISLQAVWTADNGKLPPWKGDYHHDLNTQLSYWPAYTGNYLTEGFGYLDTLWKQREINKKYTQKFFNSKGLNVPGVCTLLGEPMGGWVQYSCSPTVSAWLAQHFYLHWKYSGDTVFLKEKGYPYIKEVATFLENFTTLDQGVRKLPLSSSPEIHDNSIRAWFKETTNYDLALMVNAFQMASEMALSLNLKDEAEHWKTISGQFPELDIDENNSLTFAPGEPYRSSHRHFSHAMAFHPLGLIDVSKGERDQKIVQGTIEALKKYGPGAWVGYSYSWLGNMQARAKDGEGAAATLRDFAQCFCLRNTFHVNGDQSKSGKSGFTYRPFTLEGNFAFASGIQDMLIQSHTGTIEIFPAIPSEWKNASFNTLRTYGAYLVSAERKNGETQSVSIFPEKVGTLKLRSPFPSGSKFTSTVPYKEQEGVLLFEVKPKQQIRLRLEKK